jgi:hypothetical protein
MKGFPELGSDHFFATSQSRGQTTFSLSQRKLARPVRKKCSDPIDRAERVRLLISCIESSIEPS